MKKIMTGLLLGLFTVSCNMPEEGFFSERGIMMREDTVTIIKGLVQTSSLPMVDGSTRPILFEKIALRNLRTGEISTEDLQLNTIKMWTSAFDADKDSTMELVNKKLIERKVPAFEINAASGQVAFNGGTKFLSGDLYGIDVKASNVNSSKVFENFCVFKLIKEPFGIPAAFGDVLYGYLKDDKEAKTVLSEKYNAAANELLKANTHPNRRLTKLEDAEMVTLILVVKDAEGKPLKGKDILFWPSGTTYYTCYHDNSIAMKAGDDRVVYTDTSCIFTFPTVPYPETKRGGSADFQAHYSIDMTACTLTPAALEEIAAYEKKEKVTLSTTVVRFKSGYKINETGVWLQEVTCPYILRK